MTTKQINQMLRDAESNGHNLYARRGTEGNWRRVMRANKRQGLIVLTTFTGSLAVTTDTVFDAR